MDASTQALLQYGTSTANLDARVAIHSYGTNPISWADFVRSRLPLVLGQRVLDAGAGTGVHWQQPMDVAAVLMDAHQPMCQRLTALPFPVVQGSVEALPFPDDSMDGVLCTHVLYHVNDPSRAVDELVRVLKPGGWLGIASNGPRHMAGLDALRRSVGLVPKSPHSEHFSILDAVESMTGRRLDPVRHDFDDDLRVPDADAVVAYCETLDVLTDTQRREMRSSVAAVIAAHGHFPVRKETALVVGSKPPGALSFGALSPARP